MSYRSTMCCPSWFTFNDYFFVHRHLDDNLKHGSKPNATLLERCYLVVQAIKTQD